MGELHDSQVFRVGRWQDSHCIGGISLAGIRSPSAPSSESSSSSGMIGTCPYVLERNVVGACTWLLCGLVVSMGMSCEGCGMLERCWGGACEELLPPTWKLGLGVGTKIEVDASLRM